MASSLSDIDKNPSLKLIATTDESEVYSSRWAFWFTIVGCAVGFGNVWRFPYLCYQYGGSGFFVPYLFGLILVVWPVYLLEMGLGQMTRGGNLKAFASLGKRCRGVGMSGFTSFNICWYYPLLLCWTSLYFINSFHSEMPWTVTEKEANYCQSLIENTTCLEASLCEWNSRTNRCVVDLLGKSKNFFHNELYAWDDLTLEQHRAGIQVLSGRNVAAVFVVWMLNFLGLVAGAKVLGYIMYWTMALPSIFMVILVVVGVTLKGSGVGIRSYIAKFDFQQISQPDAWMNAIGQGVFSIGVAQGTAAALAAHNKQSQNFTQDIFVVMTADTLYSFLSGFSVFAVIGHLATHAGKEISELPLKGINLAFSTYPVGLSTVGGVSSNILCILFFATLFLIGRNALSGLTESCAVMACDSRLGRKVNLKHWQAVLGFCCFFFLLPGLLLSTNMGYHFLDALDTYSSSVAQAFGAGAQAAAVGWIYLSKYTIDRIGLWAHTIHGITWFLGSILLGVLFKTTGAVVAFPVGFSVMFGGMLIAFFLCKQSNSSNGLEYTGTDRLYYLTIYQLEPLRKYFNETACQNSKWKVPMLWSILIKYVAPTTVLFLFITTLATPSTMYSRPDMGDSDFEIKQYPWYVFLVGQFGPFGLVIFGILFFTAFPNMMTPLLPPDDEGSVKVIAEEFVPLVERPAQGFLDPEAIHHISKKDHSFTRL